MVVLTQMQQEVNLYKDEWKTVMKDVEEICALVENFSEECVRVGRSDEELPLHLKNGFKDLEG